MEEKKRIQYIDLMKGICIILVVMHNGGALGEAENTYKLFTDLVSSRMPLYFMLSGLFFKRYGSFGDFVTRKVCLLIVPIIVWSIVGLIMYDTLPWHPWSKTVLCSPSHWVAGLTTFRNTPLWFLRALFVGSIMLYCIHRICGNSRAGLAVATLAVAAISYGVYLYSADFAVASEQVRKLGMRSGVLQASAMLLFLWCGHLAGRCGVVALPRTRKNRRIAAAVGLAGVVGMVLLPAADASWYWLKFPNPWLVIVAVAACVTAMVWGFAFVVNRLPYVSYMGRYSIVVLVTHAPMISCLRLYTGWEPWPAVLAVLAVMPAVIYACVRWLPWTCAQKQLLEWRDGRVHLAAWLKKKEVKEAAEA